MAQAANLLGDGARRAKRMRPNPMACRLQVVEQPRATGLTFVAPDQSPQPRDLLVGEKSSSKAQTQPGLMLSNYEGPLTLVWYLAADSEEFPHPYILEGADCKEGVCTKTVQADGEIIRFPGLYVRRVHQRNVKKTLERRREILHRILPGRTFKQKDVTDYPLNNLRICFHALFAEQGRAGQTDSTILTRSLHCREPLLRREPRILSISQCKGSVRGREELSLEVVNISMDDMMVYFHYESLAPQTSWQEFADIMDIELRRAKCAKIVVKTPPFHDQKITTPQAVSVQIRLVDTDTTSNTVKYSYTPIVRGIPRLEDQTEQKVPIFLRHFAGMNALAPVHQDFLDVNVQEVWQPPCQAGKRGALERWRLRRSERVKASRQIGHKQERLGSPVKLGADGSEFDYNQIDWYRSLYQTTGLHPEPPNGEEDSATSSWQQEDREMWPSRERRRPRRASRLSEGCSSGRPHDTVPAIVYSLLPRSNTGPQNEDNCDDDRDTFSCSSLQSPFLSSGESTQPEGGSSPVMESYQVNSPDSGIYLPLKQGRRNCPRLSSVTEQTMSVNSRESAPLVSTEGNDDSPRCADSSQEGEEQGGGSNESDRTRSGDIGGAADGGEGQDGRLNRDGDRGGDSGRGLRPPTVTQRIDHTGGKLSLLGGELCLTIPPGALAEGQAEDIGLSVVWDEGSIPPLGPGDMNVAPVVRCSPTGLHFARPVTLQMPHCAVKSNSTTRQMTVHCNHAEEGEKPQWERLSSGENPEVRAEMGERCFILSVDHFTDFTITLDDGDQCQVKEISLVAYGFYITGLDEDQEVRIYLYDNHGSSRERIKQEEEILHGKMLHSPISYFLLELGRANMSVSVQFSSTSWLLVSPSVEKVFLFQKLWYMRSYDVCKFTWENRAKALRFMCHIKAQQALNNEECLLEISNHVKPSAPTALQAAASSTHHAQASQFHMHHTRQTVCVDLRRQEWDSAYSCRGSSMADTALSPSIIEGPPPLIPITLLQSLCTQLDQCRALCSNWKVLAEKFKLDSFVKPFESKQSLNPNFSPTERILQLAEERQTLNSLEQLSSLLKEMNRMDVASLVDKHMVGALMVGGREPLCIAPASKEEPMDVHPLSPDKFLTPKGMPLDNPREHSPSERVTPNGPLPSPNASLTSAATVQEIWASPGARGNPYRTPCLQDSASPTGPGSCSERDQNENLAQLEECIQRKLVL